jgi:hypothetical protein
VTVGVGLLLFERWIPGAWSLLLLVPMFVALIGALFFAGNVENLRATRPPALWRLRWPGGFAIVVALGALALSEAVQWLLGKAALGPVASPAIDLVLWLPSLVISTFCAIVWLDRARFPAMVQARQALRSRVVFASLVQQLRFGALGLPLVLPILASALMLYLLVPQVEDLLGEDGFGSFWSTWIATARWLSSYWWALLLALLWFVLVAAGRLLVQLGAVAPGTDPNAPTPPTRPDSAPASTAPPTA